MDNPVLLDALHNLTLPQLRAIIWRELGEDKKYNSYTRDMLMNAIRNLCSGSHPQAKRSHSSTPTPSKRTRSSEGSAGEARNPSSASNPGNTPLANPLNASCANRACRAPLQGQDGFCKRCSCSICKKYDDNKDPSVWLVCGDNGTSSSPQGCELSCHLQCALNNGSVQDTSYQCTCGFKTCLLGASKKQLLHAKEARRVNELYDRLEFAKKLLHNSQKTPPCTEYVEQALATLKDDVGPQAGISGRGLVTRLSCGSQILDLISKSLQCFGTDVAAEEVRPPHEIQFLSVGSTYFLLSVIDRTSGAGNIQGYKIFHRRARGSYRVGPTVSIQRTQKAKITELKPGTTYMVKALAFSAQGDEYLCESKCVTKPEDPDATDEGMSSRQAEADKREENDAGDRHVHSESAVNDDDVPRPLAQAIPRPPAEAIVVDQQVERIAEAGKNTLDLMELPPEDTEASQRAEQAVLALPFTSDIHPRVNSDPSQSVNDTDAKNSQPSEGTSDVNVIEDGPSNDLENTSLPNQAAGESKNNTTPAGVTVEDVNVPSDATPVNLNAVQTTSNTGEAEVSRPRFDINIPPSGSPQETNTEEEISPRAGNPQPAMNSSPPSTQKQKTSAAPKNAAGDTNKMLDPKQNKSTTKRTRAKAAPVNELEAVNNGLSLLLGGPAGMTPRPTANPALSRPNAIQDLQAIAGKPPTRKRTADEAFPTKKWSERIFEYCTRIIRYLESLGHIKPDFRMHFFTWLSTTASEQEKIAVNVYIQSLKDDPPGLAAQLIDVFTDVIESSRFNIDYDWR